ncbi:MAG: hypothetical protein ABIK28_00585 [Planctomycetota bacterium]
MHRTLLRISSGIFLFAIAALVFGYPLLSPPATGQNATETSQAQTRTFPESWHGIWKGICRSNRPAGGGFHFAMELHIRPTDQDGRFEWKLIYGEGEKRQVRDYELVIRDAAKGDYVIDEKNSITIDAVLIDSQLCAQYSVDGSLITLTYTREDEAILFRLLSSRLNDSVISGGEGEIPKVLTYPIDTAQSAVLRKQL